MTLQKIADAVRQAGVDRLAAAKLDGLSLRGTPMAVSTWLGSCAPLVQAEPLLAQMPAMSSPISMPSASTPRTTKLAWLARRSVR